MKDRFEVKKVIAIGLAILGSSSVVADELFKYNQLMEMDLSQLLKVKIATGTAKRLSEVPAVVSVITANDIAASGARTLAEAIEKVPGLHVMASEFRLSRLYSFRGIQSSSTPQVLILIDGVEISNLTSSSMPVAFRYPTHFIEKIEIIRGPGSAVYGADAFSGVINIITQEHANLNQVELGANLGSFAYQELWMNGHWAVDDLNVSWSFTREEQGNDSGRVTPYGVMDRGRELDNLHVNLSYGDFVLKNWYWRTGQQMGNGVSVAGNNIDRDQSEAYKSNLQWHHSFSTYSDITIDATYFLNKTNAYFQLFPPGTWPVGTDGNIFQPPFTPVEFPNGVIGAPRGDTQKYKLDGVYLYTGVDNHRLRFAIGLNEQKLINVEEVKNFGPGILDENSIPADGISDQLIDVTGTPYVYTPQYKRDLWYVSIQDEWKLADDWELTAGIRYDHYSDFGSTTNPRMALVWNTSSALTTKLLYGSAFRAPSVAELAYINNPATLGNPNIKPEEIQTLELVVDYKVSETLAGALNVFKYQSSDLIQLDNAAVYQNIGQQDGYGFEFEANWQASNQLEVSGNFSWLRSELPLSNEDKANVPRVMAYLALDYQFDDSLSMLAQSYLIADRKRQTGDTRSKIKDYNKLDITLRWQVSNNWRATLGIKNALDDDIRQPSPNSPLFALDLGYPDDYPMKGRSLFAGIVLSLR
ncbi:hypothetical protein C2869_21155 [Saccharobesus litoralis]|uniref:TonB-dependent receptor n=1 Tax=Saccharobesus litoralis TaxID=2172099 RepID=A0A2S0VXB1_9ALTE|nr:TonB-dependent receptor [Saccharobesus litoralis]AWB68750.1 hypothetical protein C2869_21155 [Saccharobesus litoralis]